MYYLYYNTIKHICQPLKHKIAKIFLKSSLLIVVFLVRGFLFYVKLGGA